MSIQVYQFDRSLDKGRGWQGQVQFRASPNNSVEWQVEQELRDKWIWLVTDCYEMLGNEVERIEWQTSAMGC